MNGNKKAAENVGFQTARLASFLKSWMSKFENCTGRATFFIAFCVKSLQILSVCRLFCSPSIAFNFKEGQDFRELSRE
jgi:hypothetical protein